MSDQRANVVLTVKKGRHVYRSLVQIHERRTDSRVLLDTLAGGPVFEGDLERELNEVEEWARRGILDHYELDPDYAAVALLAGLESDPDTRDTALTSYCMILRDGHLTREMVKVGRAEEAAVCAMRLMLNKHVFFIRCNEADILSARNQSKVNGANRRGTSRVDRRTKKAIVDLWDSASREGEEPWAFIRTAANERRLKLPSQPTLRQILREAGRIPPAKARK